MRLDATPTPDARRQGLRRVTEAERETAAGLLSQAQRDGRFGASDLYERRMEALVAARTQADVDALVGDLRDLVTGRVRTRMLRVIARARADGQLDFDEFCERTDRCLEPLSRAHADGLVGDLGYQVVRPLRRRPSWEPAARRVAAASVVGGLVGTALVAVPSALDLPGGLGQWMPLAVGTGIVSAIGTAIAAVAWTVRSARSHPVVLRSEVVRSGEPDPPGSERLPDR
jgi:Domain of unknown function (DUF1707)